MYTSLETKARVSAAVAESNRRRGEQDPLRRKAKRQFSQSIGNAQLRDVAFLLTFEQNKLVFSKRAQEDGR